MSYLSSVYEPYKTPQDDVVTRATKFRLTAQPPIALNSGCKFDGFVAEHPPTGSPLSFRQRTPPVDSLEPSLPEESDYVRSLIWDDCDLVGKVMSIDDDDNAIVKFSDNTILNCQVDKLCKVDPEHC